MPDSRTLTLAITGMHCGNCAAKVHAALTNTAGVSAAAVDHAAGQAQVTFDPAQTNPAALMQAVAATGFKPTGFAKS